MLLKHFTKVPLREKLSALSHFRLSQIKISYLSRVFQATSRWSSIHCSLEINFAKSSRNILLLLITGIWPGIFSRPLLSCGAVDKTSKLNFSKLAVIAEIQPFSWLRVIYCWSLSLVLRILRNLILTISACFSCCLGVSSLFHHFHRYHSNIYFK